MAGLGSLSPGRSVIVFAPEHAAHLRAGRMGSRADPGVALRARVALARRSQARREDRAGVLEQPAAARVDLPRRAGRAAGRRRSTRRPPSTWHRRRRVDPRAPRTRTRRHPPLRRRRRGGRATPPSFPRGAAGDPSPSSARRSRHDAHPRPHAALGISRRGVAGPAAARAPRRDDRPPRQRQVERHGDPRSGGRDPARAPRHRRGRPDGQDQRQRAGRARRRPRIWRGAAPPSSPRSATEGRARRAVCSTPSRSRSAESRRP